MRAWLHDAILARRRPDFSLVHTLAFEGSAAVRGIGEPLVGRVRETTSMSMPAIGENALSWTDLASSVVKAADQEMAPFLPPRRIAAYELTRDLALAHICSVRADIYHVLAFREEAIEAYREAAGLWERNGFYNLAAAARMGVAQLLLTRLGRPAEALVEAGPRQSREAGG